ncbi:hypothetical protein [Agromyces sp. LHK192]|uniref:hypothetical protein n=1 Tax=Agromyces sp. LHK192 TaxID=2498704 RepID=UPI000FDA5045|nr:hypothetical protein [Agromyces sp. LHK192]
MNSKLSWPPLLSARSMFWIGLALIAVWLLVQVLSAMISFAMANIPWVHGVPAGFPFFSTIGELALVLGAMLVGAGLVTRHLERPAA